MRISVNWLNEWLGDAGGGARPRRRASPWRGSRWRRSSPPRRRSPASWWARSSSARSTRTPTGCSVCKVSAGGELLQIVCGAPNARAGLKAPFATIGTKHAGRHGDQARRSCAASSRSACSAPRASSASPRTRAACWNCPPICTAGTPITEALDLDDTLLEINLTPNRGDCMGVLGVAREAAVLTGATLDGTAAARGARAVERALPGRAGAGRRLRALCGSRHSWRAPGCAVAAVDARAAASLGPASDQRNRGRHQLRDARARPADARLRPARAAGRHRRAARARRRDAAPARRSRHRPGRLGAGDRRPRQAARPRGRDGRRALGHRRRHDRRAARSRVLPPGGHRRTRSALRPRHRRLAALRARRRSHAAGARHRACHRVAAGLCRRHRRARPR